METPEGDPRFSPDNIRAEALVDIREMEHQGILELIRLRMEKELQGGRPSSFLEATNTVFTSLILSVQAMLRCSQSASVSEVDKELSSLIPELSQYAVDTPFNEDDAKRFIEKWNKISSKLDDL